MPHHYQKWVTEVGEWCKTCNRVTVHTVSGGRLGRCKEHSFAGVNGTGLTREQFKRREQRERERKKLPLFRDLPDSQ